MKSMFLSERSSRTPSSTVTMTVVGMLMQYIIQQRGGCVAQLNNWRSGNDTTRNNLIVNPYGHLWANHNRSGNGLLEVEHENSNEGFGIMADTCGNGCIGCDISGIYSLCHHSRLCDDNDTAILDGH